MICIAPKSDKNEGAVLEVKRRLHRIKCKFSLLENINERMITMMITMIKA